MTDATSSIQTHYGSDDLVDRIMSALEAAGHDTANPTVEMLNLVDQLHGGGLNSTKAQAELVSIAEDTRVLDAGCVSSPPQSGLYRGKLEVAASCRRQYIMARAILRR